MEEVDFFHEICLISLYASRAVKFAAVVDSKGKLILAKFKKFHIHSHCARLLSAPNILHGSQQQQDQALLPQSCHSFCYEYLMPTLKDITSRSYREHYSNKAHFEITEIDKVDKSATVKDCKVSCFRNNDTLVYVIHFNNA